VNRPRVGTCVRWLVFVCLCLTAAACDEKLSSITGPTPNLNPSLSSITQNIIRSTDSAGRPACVLCHSGPTPSGRLNLSGDVYSALVNRPSNEKPGAILVIPGDPDSSYLYQKLEGAQGISGVRMPRNGPYLTDGQIQVIERWIELGAKNN
jgi:hypothetical protein